MLFLLNVFTTSALANTSVDTTATIITYVCGNNIKEYGESCDKNDLAGLNCQSHGFFGGDLSCKIDCTFDFSKCTSGSGGGGGMIFLNSAKAIIAFTITGQVGVSTIDEKESTISLVMPAGTDVTNLVPIISITGSSISPASRVTNNFTIPQIYKVIAADGSTKNYTVTINVSTTTQTNNGATNWFINEVKRTDIIRDGVIDILDFNALMVNWGKQNIGNLANVNQDSLVDILDFNLLMVNWGQVEIVL
jgi:hypothetical protein